MNDVPAEWMDGDDGALEQLLDKLWCRRTGVAELIEDCNRAEPSLFPSWLDSAVQKRPLGRQSLQVLLFFGSVPTTSSNLNHWNQPETIAM